MGIINAIFQAIIQGLTEFIPVSSSGHLSLDQHFTGNDRGMRTFPTESVSDDIHRKFSGCD